jgi:hypothetical protein
LEDPRNAQLLKLNKICPIPCRNFYYLTTQDNPAYHCFCPICKKQGDRDQINYHLRSSCREKSGRTLQEIRDEFARLGGVEDVTAVRGKTVTPRRRLPRDDGSAVPLDSVTAAWVELLIESRLPLATADKVSHRDLASQLHITELLPRTVLGVRAAIIAHAACMRHELRLLVRGKAVTYIVDGWSKHGRHFYAQLFQTDTQIIFWKLSELEETDAGAIVGMAVTAIREASALDANVIGVCTDNASNLALAFQNASLALCAPDGIRIPHFRCGAHATGRAVWAAAKADAPLALFLKQAKAVAVFIAWPAVLARLRAGGVKGKVPRMQEDKWQIYAELGAFMDGAQPFMNELVADSRLFAGRKRPADLPKVMESDFFATLDTMRTISLFLVSIEGERKTIADFFVEANRLMALLEEKAVADRGAQVLLDCFRERLHGSAVLGGARDAAVDFAACELAHVLTEDGGRWFQGRMREAWAGGDFIEGDVARAARMELLVEEQSLQDKAVELAQMMGLLGRVTESDFRQTLHEQFRGDISWDCGEARMCVHPRVEFAALAVLRRRLLSIPATEAAAERVFSWFKWICGEDRWSANEDLLDAMITIRAAQLHRAKTFRC